MVSEKKALMNIDRPDVAEVAEVAEVTSHDFRRKDGLTLGKSTEENSN